VKVCARCRVSKPREDFYANRQWRDGRHPYCKPCLLAYQRRRRFERLDAERPERRQWTHRFVRHHYFRALDSPPQAYVLGLLAADGNVFGSRVSIELLAKDRELVELVRDELAPAVKVRARRRGTREMALLSISSRQLVADLASLAVTERKSLTLRWPEALPGSLARPFLLGYFDGDGYVTWSQNRRWRYPRWGLLGTESFLTSANALLHGELGIRRRPLHERPGCWRLAVTGRDALAVDRWLHHGFDFGLARKRFVDLPYAVLSPD
jgi:hypothetical protein